MRKLAALAAAVSVGASAWGAAAPAPAAATAVFAGGCFWSTESAFEKVYGVIEAVSGYTGGSTKNPNYGNYARAGHVEAVRVTYDPGRVSYAGLLEVYWRSIDPTDGEGQFFDRGPNYRPVIYYKTGDERRAAEDSKAALARSGKFPKPIAVGIAKEAPFYPAEEYHQDYTKKNPLDYERYRVGSGRDAFFNRVWGAPYAADQGLPPSAKNGTWRKPAVAELRKRLTQVQFAVTQTEGTEPAFANEYHDNKAEGIYVDVVSGEPLFSSTDKFDSGTGWPSFTRPLVPANIVERTDTGYGMVRVEVRSRWADSHLGHVFDDGPAPTGLRYCMNSAAMRFVPVSDMEKEGYARYLWLFKK